jgi:glycerol-3-phosphate dehydrogenase (NAD(P)+)
MKIRVAVLGAGSWGTTIASTASHNAETVLWSRREDIADDVNERHCNERYLSGFTLHPALRASCSMAEVVSGADVVVMGVPSHAFRATFEQASPHLRAWVPVVSLSKGFEQGTNLRMTEIVAEVAPGHPTGVLTGPNLAKEILGGHAAAAVLAMVDEHISERLQAIFATELFRVYTNVDVIGCEVAGAFKNVIALASGMADGLGTGDNTRAAVITRGLHELTRLGIAMGGNPLTFAGLAGMGDLVATCISPQSRNRYVGEQLGQGRSLADIVTEMDQIAEGVMAARVVKELADQHGLDLPIVNEVYAVVVDGHPATDAYRGLLRRKVGRETNYSS